MEVQETLNKMDDTTEAVNRIQETAKNRLSDISRRVLEGSKSAASTTDSYVREYAWSSVALAALLGLFLGFVIRRSAS